MKDLKKLAIESLEFNTHLNEVFVTSDGVVFVTKNDAVNHAVKLEEKEVSVFTRDDESEETPVVETILKAADVIALIEAAESEEAVNQIKGSDERKTVVAAANKRIAELKQAAIDKQAEDAEAARLAREAQNPNDADKTGDQSDADKNPTE